MPNTTLADLTTELVRLIDGQGVRPFDGHIVIDDVNYTKGTIAATVRHAHDSAEVLRFSVAVAL
jgi:hypothetical protein